MDIIDVIQAWLCFGIIAMTFVGMLAFIIIQIKNAFSSTIKDSDLKDSKWSEEIRHNTIKSEMVEKTNAFNDYIIKVCSNVATLKWQEYIDGHDIQKLTREQLKNLASECAHMVINMINLDNVDYSKLLCTQEYTTFLIINTTFNYLKRLSDKTVNDLSE